MIKGKDDYHRLTNLYVKQDWLLSKRDELTELINFCGDKESKDLIFSMLERFQYLKPDTYNYLLNEVSDYIVNYSGFVQENALLLSITADKETDSSQKILYEIRQYINKRGWNSLETVNFFTDGLRVIRKGKRQVLLIDEFVGSGKTLRNRVNYLRKNIEGDFSIKCCFIAGIKNEVEKLRHEGIDIFCAMELIKGVSGYFVGQELVKAENIMLDLELKLAQKINDKELFTYSFGYGSAEALYSLEGCNGNTPNSVFPIFWWAFDRNDKVRRTLLTRIENGL
ncbi:MAG TPA: phosphoribosyltransferase [Puia sp.]|nr:phosphoribosyltransferase [Puia sp.]